MSTSSNGLNGLEAERQSSMTGMMGDLGLGGGLAGFAGAAGSGSGASSPAPIQPYSQQHHQQQLGMQGGGGIGGLPSSSSSPQLIHNNGYPSAASAGGGVAPPPPPLQPNELPSRSSFSSTSAATSPSLPSTATTAATVNQAAVPGSASGSVDSYGNGNGAGATSSASAAFNGAATAVRPVSELTHRSSMSPSLSGLGSAGGSSETTTVFGSGGGRGVGLGSVSELGLTAGGAGAGEGASGGVPEGFDEGVLRALCDLDCALPLVTERIKQSIISCKQVAAFFRARAELEEKYARSMMELVRTSADNYARSFGKPGSFVDAYHNSFRIHESLASNRLRFSQRLSETSDELLLLAKEGERLRKLHKDNGAKYERNVQDAEAMLDKAKSKFDSTAEELERILIAKEGESVKETSGIASQANANKEKRGIGKAMKTGGMLFKGKASGNMQKQADDLRSRLNQANDSFRKAHDDSQSVKQEYFNLQLPKILRLLKECADEIDMGTQYHLTRYAFLYETTTAADGELLSPSDSPGGLKATFESIDNRNDFKKYMQNFAVARGSMRTIRRDTPQEDGFSPALPPHVQASQLPLQSPPTPTAETSLVSNGDSGSVASHQIPSAAPSASNSVPRPATFPAAGSTATFGVELGEQMVRDGTEVPKIVEKCSQAIEQYGIDSMGIYRLSGTTSKVQRLKAAFDRDIDNVDPMSEEFGPDINVVSGALKLWFRELPEPLLTHELYQRFIDAASLDNDRLRHIRTHEVVNDLPDPNYACLKYFMGHLDQVRRHESQNSMSISNLSIVFGPTLLIGAGRDGTFNLDHTPLQSKCIETILEHYEDIFVEAED